MTGRIEYYIHSDSTTRNKGGALICVSSQSDFAARTNDFVTFCAMAAKFAYAADAATWDDVARLYPEAETARLDLETRLHEAVLIEKIVILHI